VKEGRGVKGGPGGRGCLNGGTGKEGVFQGAEGILEERYVV
jgi:hypothetical protein